MAIRMGKGYFPTSRRGGTPVTWTGGRAPPGPGGAPAMGAALEQNSYSNPWTNYPTGTYGGNQNPAMSGMPTVPGMGGMGYQSGPEIGPGADGVVFGGGDRDTGSIWADIANMGGILEDMSPAEKASVWTSLIGAGANAYGTWQEGKSRDEERRQEEERRRERGEALSRLIGEFLESRSGR